MPKHVDDDLPEFSPSHLTMVDVAFGALVAEPRRLRLDCTVVGGVPGPELGLPAGPVELPWLRDWLLGRSRGDTARDAVWRELVDRARRRGGDWRVVAAAMAMPGLVRKAAELARGFRGDPADLDNEILTGFLEALDHRVDPGRARLYASLLWAGYRAGKRLRDAETPVVPFADLDNRDLAHTPHLPYGHVDLLLARAVSIRLISQDDADLITATQLERTSLERVAARTAVDLQLLRTRRFEAGQRVALALHDGTLSGVISSATRAALAGGTDEDATPGTQGPVPFPATRPSLGARPTCLGQAA